MNVKFDCYKIFAVFLLQFYCFNIINGQNSCRTSNGKPGQCILLEFCPALFAVSQQRPLSNANRQYLAQAQCGTEGNQVKVCCEDNTSPAPCQTPSRIQGQCIPIKTCQPLVQLIKQRPLPEATREYLRQSQCDTRNNQVYVCCPPANVVGLQASNKPSVVTESIRPVDTGNGIIVRSNLLPTDCGTQKIVDRIVGGDKAGIYEFPSIALLQYERNRVKRFGCGGAIINNRYILTAAHCVKGEAIVELGPLISVRVGEYDTRNQTDCAIDNGKRICHTAADIPVEDIIPHRGWVASDSSQINDIALIRVKDEIKFTDFVRPVCLANKGRPLIANPDNDALFVVGWGLTENNTRSPEKLKLRIPLQDISVCQKEFQKIVSTIQLNNDLQFCGGGKAGQDSCRGDSGGPAIKLTSDEETSNNIINVLIGVISFGPDPCGQPGIPGVYTRVDAHLDWIISKLKP